MKLLMISVVLAASSAWACVCKIGGPTFPHDGATNVPTNAAIRLLYNRAPEATEFTLRRTSDQQEVALEFSTAPVAPVFTFTPVTTLDANTAYTLISGERVVTSFTTGAGEDHEPPSKPTLVNSTYEFSPDGRSCGDSKRWTLDITGGDDDVSPREDLIVLVHETAPIGATTLANPTLGVFLCRTNFVQPSGSPMLLSVQVMDLAGNVSELSSTQQVRACSIAPGGAALMLLASLLLRRRRR